MGESEKLECTWDGDHRPDRGTSTEWSNRLEYSMWKHVMTSGLWTSPDYNEKSLSKPLFVVCSVEYTRMLVLMINSTTGTQYQSSL